MILETLTAFEILFRAWQFSSSLSLGTNAVRKGMRLAEEKDSPFLHQ
jgi:hypothetical protein